MSQTRRSADDPCARADCGANAFCNAASGGKCSCKAGYVLGSDGTSCAQCPTNSKLDQALNRCRCDQGVSVVPTAHAVRRGAVCCAACVAACCVAARYVRALRTLVRASLCGHTTDLRGKST